MGVQRLSPYVRPYSRSTSPGPRPLHSQLSTISPSPVSSEPPAPPPMQRDESQGAQEDEEPRRKPRLESRQSTRRDAIAEPVPLQRDANLLDEGPQRSPIAPYAKSPRSSSSEESQGGLLVRDSTVSIQESEPSLPPHSPPPPPLSRQPSGTGVWNPPPTPPFPVETEPVRRSSLLMPRLTEEESEAAATAPSSSVQQRKRSTTQITLSQP